MKFCAVASAMLAVAALMPAAAAGQANRARRLSQPTSLERVAFEYDDYLGAGVMAAPLELPAEASAESPSPSPSDVPESPREAAPAPAAGAGNGGCECAACCPCFPYFTLFPCGELGDPWKIPQPCLLQRLGIGVGGWIQQGITANGDDPADRFNGPLATNDRAGEYQLNQAWLYFVRPVNTGGCGFDIGGRVDVVYGTDWRFGMNKGLEDNIDSNQQFYGLVLPQFYLEVGYNDWTVKMGHYAADFGYEMVPAVGNFFYSHSYLMSYTEPLLVTGVQADYALTDQWDLTCGFNRGWMMFEDTNDALDVLGGVRWTSFDKQTAAKFLVTSGDQTFAGITGNWFGYSLVFNHQFSERFRYVLQHTLGVADNFNPRTGGDARWYGLCNYFLYTINPCWSAGLRYEWLEDDGGGRVLGVGNWIGSERGWTGGPGFDGTFQEISLGLNWRPHANLVLRPETRWDWYTGTTDVRGRRPFDAGGRNDQFTFAVDLIATF